MRFLVLAATLTSGCAGCGKEPAPSDDCEVELHRDADGDGFGAEEAVLRCPGSGWIEAAGDCDDGNAAIHPGANDPPCDGIDADCEIEDLALVGDVFYGTLDEAVAAAGPDEVVQICPGFYAVNLVHEGDLTLEAYDANPMDTVLTSAGGGSILDVTGDVTIRDLWFQGGEALQGGAIAVRGGVLLVEGARFTDMEAALGGAIYAEGGAVVIRDAWFEEVLARDVGAALWAGDALEVELTGSSFVDGRSYGDAAAVFAGVGPVLVDGCTFTGNEATRSGGALKLYKPASATILGSSFVANRAYGAYDGGALEYTGQGLLRVEDTSFRENFSACGSAMALDGYDTVTVEMIGGEVVGNVGAAISTCSWAAAHIQLDGVLLAENSASAVAIGSRPETGYAGSLLEIYRSTIVRHPLWGVGVDEGAEIVSVDSDWGEGADDNATDLHAAGESWTDLGADESFSCDEEACSF